jgi:cytochrome c-type biogenesis protein CcmE
MRGAWRSLWDFGAGTRSASVARMSRKLLVGIVALAAGILAVVFGWPSPKAVYALSIAQFVAHPTYDEKVRIEGTLVRGSLCYRAEPCEFRFRLAERSSAPRDSGPVSARPELAVRYPSCFVPDTFREVPGFDIPVTVEGQLCVQCHRFEASAVFAKCPGKYFVNGRYHCLAGPTEVEASAGRAPVSQATTPQPNAFDQCREP